MDHILPESNFVETNFLGQIKHNRRCIDVYNEDKIKICDCHGGGGNQALTYNINSHIASSGGKCLSILNDNVSVGFHDVCKDDILLKWKRDDEVTIFTYNDHYFNYLWFSFLLLEKTHNS